MNKVKLDTAEKELMMAYESGVFESVLTPSRRQQIREAATAHLQSAASSSSEHLKGQVKKHEPVNIQTSSRDSDAI